MSYNNDERLITILRLIKDGNLGTDRTGTFAKSTDLIDEMGDEAVVNEILPILINKNYIRKINDKFESIHNHALEYDAYQITAMGTNYLSTIGPQSLSIGSISGSNVAINSAGVNQILDKQTDKDMQVITELLQDLADASNRKDKLTILKTLGYIGDKYLDLLIAIIAGGVKL